MSAHKSDIGRFTMTPEWLIEAGASPGAVYLFVVLGLKANQSNGQCWPTRKTLAEISGCSRDTIDRRVTELVALGALEVENRLDDQGDPTSNLYTVRFAHPEMRVPAPVRGGGRTDAVTGGGMDAVTGGRTDAAQNYTQIEPESFEQDQPSAPDGTVVDLFDPQSERDRGFDQFWDAYPKRNGKRVGKKSSLTRWRKFTIEDRFVIFKATKNYAIECVGGRQIAKDPERFLKDEFWQDWIDPPDRVTVREPKQEYC